jgi:hypothetical protein
MASLEFQASCEVGLRETLLCNRGQTRPKAGRTVAHVQVDEGARPRPERSPSGC